MTTARVSAFVLLCSLALNLPAQVPQLINYQGRIAVAGSTFDGTGQFKFALVNGTGSATFWSNDGTGAAGGEPLAAVSLTVAKGLYSVLLGDATLPNMSIVPATVFTNADVRLRVWFNDGSHGSQLMTPDQRIAAVGYAMMAGSAQTVPDGAITSAKLAVGAVLAGNIAAGAVGVTQLANGAAAANLSVSGQSVVASGGIVLSETVNPNLVNAGYVRIGTTTLNDEWEQRNGKDAPAARDRHTAVWTGSEMIIWGGAIIPEGYELSHFNDGARYNPATGAWTAISTNGAPSGRISHTAVWTGSEMIIWGGLGGYDTGYTNAPGGARYNPASDSWTTVSTVAAPSSRHLHTAVWTGTEMIIWGGATWFNPHTLHYLGDGARYNPATDSWTPVNSSDAPSERVLHTAVWTGSKMIVWGGMTNHTSLGTFSNGACYTPSSDSWAPVSAGPLGRRAGHLAAWTGSEMFIWGGEFGGNPSHGALYSPTSDSWTVILSAGQPYFDTDLAISKTAVWTGSNVFVFGMAGGGFYLPSEDIWKASSPPPSSRNNHTAVWTGSEMIVWGGNGFTDTWIYHLPKTMHLYQKP